MKALGYVAVGLLLQVSVRAQTQSAPQTAAAEVKPAQTAELSGLIAQANAAAHAKDWPKMKGLAEELVAAVAKLAAAYPDDPDVSGSQPECYRLLGDAHLGLGEFKDAIDAYEKSAGFAQTLRDGGKDSPGLRKTAREALTSEGNAWLKTKKAKEAMACYERAVEFDPDSAKAWFNICAAKYNSGDMVGADAAADKVIALDPTKADAYFIKGSCLFANGAVEAGGKYVVSAAAMVALRKYLDLAPSGAHAADAKQMLEAPGITVK
jgi:tetratricopeptide (TPR) repeat protein